ncbi:MAG: phosphate/phosphite/phosphonate ABC transporter substrate-binding protein [Sphingorhabdus sp.]
MQRLVIVIASIIALVVAFSFLTKPASNESAPLRVVLIPADGGTEDGTLADYRPVFAAVEHETGIKFELRAAQSYSAVVEAMCNNTADIAFVGAVTFLQASKRGCAEMLAVSVTSGRSEYFSAFFARRDGGIKSLADVKGKRAAFGDINSTSSFVYPIAMLIDAGIDPVADLGSIRMTGSHASSLSALIGGQVDVAAISFESYNKALSANVAGARDVIVIARSEPIPNPPLIMNPKLPDSQKIALRSAFQMIAKQPGVTPEMVRGYGGDKVDGYDTHFPAARFQATAAKVDLVDARLTGALVARASEN